MSTVDIYTKNLEKGQQKLNNAMKEGTKQIEKELQDKKEQKDILLSLIESYNGMRNTMKNFSNQSIQVATMLQKYSEIEDKISELEYDIIDLENRYSKMNKDLQKKDDDDEIDKMKQKMKTIDTNKQQKEKELLSNRNELRQIKKALSNFYEFGEVSNLLLLKNRKENISLTDYELVKTLGGRNNNVGLYKNNNGEHVVLKIFVVGQDYSKLKRQEELLLNLPKNPLILPINRIFYEKGVAYVEMPYIEGGTLREWMKTKKSVREIQNMLRLIAQGIICLHNHDIIHCDLNPENILIKMLNETALQMLSDN